MLFSIITATKNSGDDFARTGTCLRNQTFQGFEWIVVSSSDNKYSLDIIDVFSDSIDILIFCEPRGISDAWNKGLSSACGEYILILNAGDIYSPDYLDDIRRLVLKSEEPLFVVSSSCTKKGLNGKSSMFYTRPDKLWRGMHIPHNWMCVKADVYKRVGQYSELANAMDFEWIKRMITIYGLDAITTLNPRRSYGTYYLGGHSDINYRAGLISTMHINRSFGMSTPLSYLLFVGYLIHHLCHLKSSK
jgi:glycosyltransferase involved in cell wall biosynthesis